MVLSSRSPGLMYAESRDEHMLKDWVSAVQALRYKDFRCIAKPALIPDEAANAAATKHTTVAPKRFHETESMAHFVEQMEARRLGSWWKRHMGYE